MRLRRRRRPLVLGDPREHVGPLPPAQDVFRHPVTPPDLTINITTAGGMRCVCGEIAQLKGTGLTDSFYACECGRRW